jgi:hypothetical protein
LFGFNCTTLCFQKDNSCKFIKIWLLDEEHLPPSCENKLQSFVWNVSLRQNDKKLIKPAITITITTTTDWLTDWLWEDKDWREPWAVWRCQQTSSAASKQHICWAKFQIIKTKKRRTRCWLSCSMLICTSGKNISTVVVGDLTRKQQRAC